MLIIINFIDVFFVGGVSHRQLFLLQQSPILTFPAFNGSTPEHTFCNSLSWHSRQNKTGTAANGWQDDS